MILIDRPGISRVGTKGIDMQNHLTNSSALYRTGISPNRRLLKVPSGPYTGRTAVLIQTSPPR